MAYATVADVQARMSTTMDTTQQNICSNLLDDSAVIIDGFNANASADVKKIVSIRMVQRALNVDTDIPLGATQGRMSALGYSQSWTMGSNSSVGELYLNKLEKQMLGCGNSIGFRSPLEYMTRSSI